MVGPAVPPVGLINGQAEPPVLPLRTTPFSEEAISPALFGLSYRVPHSHIPNITLLLSG
jgi:hypothetical protein